MSLSTISDRDRTILRAQCAEVIDGMLVTVEMAREDDLPWRPTFERLAREARTRANGCPSMSDARDVWNTRALAYEFVLIENPS